MYVLVIEDPPSPADSLGHTLHSHDIPAYVARSGPEADALLQGEPIAAVVLDADSSQPNGFALLRRLRARGSRIPVIVLIARDAVHDRAQAMALGADDCLTKPFPHTALIERLRALMRRDKPAGERLQVGDLVMDFSARRVYANGQGLLLSAREWAVLEYLMRQTGRIVSRQQIIDGVLSWGKPLKPNAAEVYVSRVRAKIAAARIVIRTVRGIGYTLEPEPSHAEKNNRHTNAEGTDDDRYRVNCKSHGATKSQASMD